jgi:putative ABC transport system ATP-binding protein
MILVEDFAQHISAGGQQKLIARVPYWRVNKGDACLILGASGCGKTTLINALTGLVRPSQGQILVDGVAVGALSPSQCDHFRGRTFGIVFQTLRLIASLNLKQNLALALRLAGQDVDTKRIEGVLSQLGLSAHLHAKPRTLSTGEAQRAAIARALITRPKILVADEPTSALDDDNTQNMITLLKSLAQEAGSTLLIASHDQRLIAHFPQHLAMARPA